MASYYLDAYSSHICVVGNGKIQIWFEALGTGDMDEIGTLRIMVYESSDNATWTWKKLTCMTITPLCLLPTIFIIHLMLSIMGQTENTTKLTCVSGREKMVLETHATFGLFLSVPPK